MMPLSLSCSDALKGHGNANLLLVITCQGMPYFIYDITNG